VVDLEPFFGALKKVLPWILTVPGHSGLVSPDQARQAESPATCILCAICDSDIKSIGEVSPAALVKNLRLAVDPRDSLGSQRMKITGLNGEGLQTFQMLLARICPKKIEIPTVAQE